MKLSLDLPYSATGQLHEGYDQGEVRGHSVKCTILILEVLEIDLEDQLVSEGAKMAESHICASI